MIKMHAIFGGTFDPFTPAHRAIVKAVLATGKVDKVYIAPTIVNYHRDDYEPWLDDSDKVSCIRAALMDLKEGVDWEIWDLDLKIRRFCNTIVSSQQEYLNSMRFIDTLMTFKALVCDKDEDVYVVIGSDSYKNFSNWAYSDMIAQHAQLMVVDGRNDDTVQLPAIGPIAGRMSVINISKDLASCSATAYREEYRKISARGVDTYIDQVLMPIFRSKVLLTTPIFSVIEGQLEPNGLKPILVDAPDWVTIVVHKNGKYLVEQQYRYGSESVITEFPCGTVERGESPLEAAVRELEEETGIRISTDYLYRIVKLGRTSPNPAFMQNSMHYFYVDLDTVPYEQVGTKFDQHEQITSQWMDWSEVNSVLVNAAALGDAPVPAIGLSALLLVGTNNLISPLYQPKAQMANDEEVDKMFEDANAQVESAEADQAMVED